MTRCGANQSIPPPELNPLYRDVMKHYHVVVLQCRVNTPNRKGKVERGVGHAKNTPVKGLRFDNPKAAWRYCCDARKGVHGEAPV